MSDKYPPLAGVIAEAIHTIEHPICSGGPDKLHVAMSEAVVRVIQDRFGSYLESFSPIMLFAAMNKIRNAHPDFVIDIERAAIIDATVLGCIEALKEMLI